jgi:hypothetical protein
MTALAALLGSAVLATACQVVTGTGMTPVVWQQDAYLGDNVALPIASNAVPSFNIDDSGSGSPGTNVFRISKENVWVRLQVAPNAFRWVPVDAVIETSVARSSAWASAYPGAWMAIVVFRIPTDLAITVFPAEVPLQVAVDGIVGSILTSRLTILGPGGTPSTFNPSLSDLENPPMLRLRARVGEGAFAESCQIGAIQFDLSYSSAVSDPQAYVNSEAFRGTATLAVTGSGTARVVLVAPDGFWIQDVDDWGGSNDVAGSGPMLDIAFTKNAPFDASDFQINNLQVAEPDGTICVSQPDQESTSAFQLTVIRG